MDVKSIVFYKMQQQRCEVFKLQNLENGDFDVTFEVDGKKIYANKYVLTSISETFKSMLSDRWTTKDEAIILDGYGFEEFYQFLCFIYSGECGITDGNIFTMIDIAEYYQVEAFKDVCDEYLSKMKYEVNNVSTFMECENKYSLVKLRAKLVEYVDKNFLLLLESIGLNAKKFAIDYFFSSPRTRFREKKLFEAIYNWAENHVSIKEKLSIIDPESLKEAVKEELADYMPKFDFVKMSHKFLLQFVVTKCGYLFSHEDLGKILVESYNKDVKHRRKLDDTATVRLEESFQYDDMDETEEVYKTSTTANQNIARLLGPGILLSDYSDDEDVTIEFDDRSIIVYNDLSDESD